MLLFPCPCVNNFFSRQHVDTSRAIGLMLFFFVFFFTKAGENINSSVTNIIIHHRTYGVLFKFHKFMKEYRCLFFSRVNSLREQRMDLMVLVIGKLYSSASVSLLTQVKIIYSSAMKLSFRPDKSKSCPLTTDKGSKSDPSL